MTKKIISLILLLSVFTGVFLTACEDKPEPPDDGDDGGDVSGRPIDYSRYDLYTIPVSINDKSTIGTSGTLSIEKNENVIVKYWVICPKFENPEYSVEMDDIAFGEVVRYEFEESNEYLSYNEDKYKVTILTVEIKPDTSLIPPNPKYDNIIYGYLEFTLYAGNLDELDENETDEEVTEDNEETETEQSLVMKELKIHYLTTPYIVFVDRDKSAPFFNYNSYLIINKIISKKEYNRIKHYLGAGILEEAFPNITYIN